jgi:hypothetical protein
MSIRSIYGTIKRFLYWGWKMRDNYDFDHTYIYIMLKLKISRMSKLFIENDYTEDEDWNHSRRAMEFCINVLDRLIEDEYSNKQTDILDAKFGASEMTSEQIASGKTFRVIFMRNGIEESKTPDHEEYHEEFLRRINFADRKRKRDINLLFKVMEQRIEYWWD